jgi:FkbM family methyltransferase
MGKLITYFLYLFDYLKNGDAASVRHSILYLRKGKSHSENRMIRTSIGRFQCRANTNDFQFANLYYEWSVKRFILSSREKYTLFIDGGACIGDYSILLSSSFHRCLAFEPVTENFRALSENIGLNGLEKKIETFPYALGEVNERIYFLFNPVNTGASCKSPGNEPTRWPAEQRTFDSLLPEMSIDPAERVLFKLDIEGMENEALRGAGKFLREHPEITLIIESKHSDIENIKCTLSGFARFEFGIVDDYNIFAKKLNT